MRVKEWRPNLHRRSKLAPAIWVLGFASFLTDVSSEMIYPLLPLFLTQVLGASLASLGLIEGIAEATSGVTKIYAGVLTDRLRQRKLLIFFGYGLSGMVRPLIGLAMSWWAVLVIRFADRIGKGIRTAPRDALIADVVQPEDRGKAYGLHRAMDHAGSVVGPIIAGFLLTFLELELRTVFLLAAVPAFLTLAVLWWGIKEKDLSRPLVSDSQAASSSEGPSALGSSQKAGIPGLRFLRSNYEKMDSSYQKMLFCLFIFTLGDVSDAFILLHLNSVGIPTQSIPILWMLLHLVKMAASAIGGRWTDKIGTYPMIFMGWVLVSLIYLIFSETAHLQITVILFLVYGLYFGFTEPAERALVANIARDSERGMAFGLLHFTIAMGVLPAGLLFGSIWEVFGENVAFKWGGFVTAFASFLLYWKILRNGTV